MNILKGSIAFKEEEKRPKAISYIRFSTPEQEMGDSERRQLEAARKWCREEGYELDEDNSLQDRGISAFRGANKQGGSLGRLLAEAQQGLICEGTPLIVESFDRISREDPMSQFKTLCELVDSGFVVVDLASGGKTHGRQCSDASALFSLMATMIRGHEESAIKSRRVGAAWNNKRSKASDELVALTSICPNWLKKQGSKYVLIPERAKIVREIFDMCLRGYGCKAIARHLNERGTAPWGKARGGNEPIWRDSYIDKILSTKAVIGEYQPHTKPKGKPRTPVGEPIEGYFPAVIEEDVFFSVKAKRSSRKGGRSTDTAKNLFSGKLYCIECGSKLVFQDKGAGNGGKRYSCERKTLKAGGCSSNSIPYDEVEHVILAKLDQIEWETVVDSSNKTLSFSEKIDAKNEELESVRRKERKLIDFLSEDDDESLDTSRFMERVKSFQSNALSIEEEIAELEARQQEQNKFYESASGYEAAQKFLSQPLTQAQRLKLKSNLADILSGGAFKYAGSRLKGAIVSKDGKCWVVDRDKQGVGREQEKKKDHNELVKVYLGDKAEKVLRKVLLPLTKLGS